MRKGWRWKSRQLQSFEVQRDGSFALRFDAWFNHLRFVIPLILQAVYDVPEFKPRFVQTYRDSVCSVWGKV